MDIFIGVIVGLIVLMVLVVAHEFGHFIAARRNGVNVLEFGIGFPPRAVAWIKDPKTDKWRRLKRTEWEKSNVAKVVGAENKKAVESAKNREDDKKIIQKGLIFSINWLPIGGFCQMDGESAEDSRRGTFGNASFLKKTKILFAGVAANWLVAFVIFTVLAWVGMPNFLDGQFTVEADTRVEHTPVQVKSVHEDSPAKEAGFLENDYIVKVNGEEVGYGSDIIEINQKNAGKEVTYEILREGETKSLTAALNSADSDFLLGVTMESSQSLAYSTWSAPIVGAGLTLQLTGETFKGLGQLVWNLISGIGQQLSFDGEVRESGREAIQNVGDSVTGPVGIIGVLFPSFTSAGPSNLAFLAALISVSLACMNVLPIPALDGGRWFLIAIFKLRKKRLTKEIEEKIVARAFIILLALIVIVTILDITRFFR
ncbi:site-2 protease family protein [Candidatus Saccharibacteria bacterium]|nr:site-2 protease family protein [Candidatus Saccharibacteria bacterium]